MLVEQAVNVTMAVRLGVNLEFTRLGEGHVSIVVKKGRNVLLLN
jgi:hypothetical protein